MYLIFFLVYFDMTYKSELEKKYLQTLPTTYYCVQA